MSVTQTQTNVTLAVDGFNYNSKTNKYSISLNDVRLLKYIAKDKKCNIVLEIDADKVSNIPKLSDIDAILDEVDQVESKSNKQQQTQPKVEKLDKVRLFYSIINNDIDYIKQCIVNGLINDVNARLIPQGRSPSLPMLPFAVSQGQYEICAMLVNLGADHSGTQSLWWSQSGGHYHIERLLTMSKFGGSASQNITNAIRKVQFQTSLCNKLLSNDGNILNDNWFDALTDYMCYIINERRAFSDDLMMISWHYIRKTHSNPLESKLWTVLIKSCKEIIESRSKNDWFWLNQYVLKSAIWLQHHPLNKRNDTDKSDEIKVWKVINDETDIKRITIKELLFIELYNITSKQAKIEGAKLKSLETANENSWFKLCKYHIETKYENKVVRQDVIPNGLKPIKTKQELMSTITPTYNPILFYDLEQYLPSLISIAYNVNDAFQESMRNIFKIDAITNSSQNSSLENTKIVNTHYRSGPVKLITRCKAKVANEYFTECEFPSAAHLLDINRCLLTFPDVDTMLNGLQLFQNAIINKESGCIKEIVRIKNGFALYDGNNPNYADIKLNVIIAVGNTPIIGEVQFLFEEMSRFKRISHKLYGILRLEEEYNNLCQVMPTLLSLENDYQFLQCTKDSKAVNRLIVEHDKDIKFFISGLNMKNLCNHNGVKVLKVLIGFLPKKILNHAIEAQSALRKACAANQLEMIECLLQNFDISMDEARIAYSISLSNGIKPIIELLQNKFGSKQLSSASSMANAVSFDDTYLYSLQLPNNGILPIMSLNNQKGIILWLDSTDKSTLSLNNKIVSSWQCKVNKKNKLIGNESRPYLRRFPDIYCNDGVYFNFNHCATLGVPITNIRTICSLHSMENSHSYKSKGSERGGAKQNFYILTSAAHFSFHGKTSEDKICDAKWAHKSYQNGTIRLDCIKKEHKVKDCKAWDGETKIAILTLFENINDVKFDRIGRDRIYHHFSGSIAELIVFDRVLDETEKSEIENYFVYKHFGPVINTIYGECRKRNLISYCANYIVALLYGNHILQKFIQKK